MHVNTMAVPSTISRVLYMSAASFAFAVLIALSAQLRFPIPGSPVPITLQTCALLAGAGLLKRGYALQMVAWYIGLGLVAAPFFAYGCGAGYLFGATGGYLMGFVAAAALVGYGIDRTTGWWHSLALYLAAAFLIYLPGLAQLKLVTNASWQATLAMGAWPFILFDLVKAAAALAGVRLVNGARQRIMDNRLR